MPAPAPASPIPAPIPPIPASAPAPNPAPAPASKPAPAPASNPVPVIPPDSSASVGANPDGVVSGAPDPGVDWLLKFLERLLLPELLSSLLGGGGGGAVSRPEVCQGCCPESDFRILGRLPPDWRVGI